MTLPCNRIALYAYLEWHSKQFPYGSRFVTGTLAGGLIQPILQCNCTEALPIVNGIDPDSVLYIAKWIDGSR